MYCILDAEDAVEHLIELISATVLHVVMVRVANWGNIPGKPTRYKEIEDFKDNQYYFKEYISKDLLAKGKRKCSKVLGV